MPDIDSLLADLDAESADLDAIVSADLGTWSLDTPAAGWTIAHQIAHLAWTDHVATQSATDQAAFAASITAALTDGADAFVDRAARAWLAPAPELLERWRDGRTALTAALREVPGDTKMPWYGVAMSPVSMATGRVMETWAHGQDIADALGVTRQPTARLRHIVHLATRTVGFSFAAHDRPAPEAPVRLELTAPDGVLWTYGPDGAENVITGTALDFCLVATHRRHRDDVRLSATGEVADAWLDVIQTFAGPPGDPRAPLGAPA